MADERLKPDANSKHVMGALTDDSSLDIVALRADPTTKRLEVDSIADATITGGTITVISGGTINIKEIASGTVNTTVTITSLGTVTTLSSGTVNATINSGTITTVSTLSSISDGTIHVHELASGTVNINSLPTVYIGDGTVTTTVTIGTLNIADGTISSGTVNIKEIAGGTITTVSGGTINIVPTGVAAVGTVTLIQSISDGTIHVHELGSGTVNVSTGTVNATINSGTIAAVTTVSTVSTVSSISDGTVHVHELASGTIGVIGTIAHDSADAGNPIKIGAKVETDLSGITACADGDRTDIYADADGMLFVKPYASSANVVIGTGSLSAAGTAVLIPAQGATKKTHLMGLSIVNNSSTNTSVYVSDGSYILKWHISAPANGGAVQSFTVPLNGSANNSWQFSPSTASGSLWVSAVGYTSVV